MKSLPSKYLDRIENRIKEEENFKWISWVNITGILEVELDKRWVNWKLKRVGDDFLKEQNDKFLNAWRVYNEDSVEVTKP